MAARREVGEMERQQHEPEPDTVREADQMLSELAGGGHLSVESAGGTLRYSLPDRRATELGGHRPAT